MPAKSASQKKSSAPAKKNVKTPANNAPSAATTATAAADNQKQQQMTNTTAAAPLAAATSTATALVAARSTSPTTTTSSAVAASSTSPAAVDTSSSAANVIHTIAPSPLGGVGVFATAEIPARSTILIDHPSAPYVGRCQRCAGGKKSATTALERCNGCRCVWYCSAECRKADRSVHEKECGSLALARKAQPATLAHHVVEAEQSLLCAWVTAVLEGSRGIQKGRRLLDFRYCADNTEQDRPAAEIYYFLPEASKALYNRLEFIALVRMFNTNIFEGGHFYPTISRLNHSCSPNAVQVNGVVQSLAPIQKGEEIVINYLHGTSQVCTGAPASIRRVFLLNQWRFFCNCTACHDPASRTMIVNSNSSTAVSANHSSANSDAGDSANASLTQQPATNTNTATATTTLAAKKGTLDTAAQWTEGLSHGFLCPSEACSGHPLIAACRELMFGPTNNDANNTDDKKSSNKKIIPSRAMTPETYTTFVDKLQTMLRANTHPATTSAGDAANNQLQGPPPLFIPTHVPFGPTDAACCRCGGSMKALFGDAKDEDDEAKIAAGKLSPLTPAPARRAIWDHVLKYLTARGGIMTDYRDALASALEIARKQQNARVEREAAAAAAAATAANDNDGASATEGTPKKEEAVRAEPLPPPITADDRHFEHSPILSHRLSAAWALNIAMDTMPLVNAQFSSGASASASAAADADGDAATSGRQDFAAAAKEFGAFFGPSAMLLDPTQFSAGDFASTAASIATTANNSNNAKGGAKNNGSNNKKKGGNNNNGKAPAEAASSSLSDAPTVSAFSVFNAVLSNVYGLSLGDLVATAATSAQTNSPAAAQKEGADAVSASTSSAAAATATAAETSPEDASLFASAAPLLPPMLGILPTNVHWLRLTTGLDELFDTNTQAKGGKHAASTAANDLETIAICRLAAALRTNDTDMIPSVCRNLLKAKHLQQQQQQQSKQQTSASAFLAAIDARIGTSLDNRDPSQTVLDSVIAISNLHDHTDTYFIATVETASQMARAERLPTTLGKSTNARVLEKLQQQQAATITAQPAQQQKGKGKGGKGAAAKASEQQQQQDPTFVPPGMSAFGVSATKELMSIVVSAGRHI